MQIEKSNCPLSASKKLELQKELSMFPVPKILIVDDEPRMCDSLRILLSGQDYEVVTATSGHEALAFLSEDAFDIVLMDIVMPDMNGYQLMDHINSRRPDTFVIVITGHATLDSAVRALRKGAYDYLKKPFEYDELLKTVQNAINQKKLMSENAILNGKLAISEDRYRYLVQNSPDMIYTLDKHGNFTFVNSAAERLIGYKTNELIGKHYTSVIYDEDLEKARWFFNEKRTGDRTAAGVKIRLNVYNGNQNTGCEKKYRTVELKSTGMYDKPTAEKNTNYLGTHGVARDISDRLLLESQLQQAQKMEALGTLAGGIAHDFNNLLMGIEGNAALMLLDIDYSHPHYDKLKKIEQCVKNGADLTQQLLGFARSGKYQAKPTNLNDLVYRSSEMFGRTKKEIRIHTKFQPDLWTAEVDQVQIEQVLLNLYINAWQAMPMGGELFLQTENVTLDDLQVKPYGIHSGRYVKVAVTDTGTGMDKATLGKIFDPFFTTKEPGRGTGLGLASAYGIIKNHFGVINVYSEKGLGSTFQFYLPASEAKVIDKTESEKDILRGQETILIIDDEKMIIDVGKEIMENLGYEVLIAGCGKEAVEVYRYYQDKIAMVILDMIMPDMGGKETYDQLKALDADIKVLLASGYSLNGQAKEILAHGCDSFIQKPFNIRELSHKLREILDKK